MFAVELGGLLVQQPADAGLILAFKAWPSSVPRPTVLREHRDAYHPLSSDQVPVCVGIARAERGGSESPFPPLTRHPAPQATGELAQGKRGRDLKADEKLRCTETWMISKGKSLLRSVCPSGKLLKSLALGGPGSVLRSTVPPAAPFHPCQAELLGSVRPSCSTPLLPFPLVSPLPSPCTPGGYSCPVAQSPGHPVLLSSFIWPPSND